MKKLNTTNAATIAAESKAPAPALKKVSLAGFATQTPASKSAKAYPLLPDPDGQVGELVTSILDKSAQLEALEGALELEKGELIAIAKPFYFAHTTTASMWWRRQWKPAAQTAKRSEWDSTTPTDRGTSDEPAISRLAGEHAARYFKQSFELKIKGDLIPDAAVEPLLAELQEMFARHGASAALSAKATIKPTREFHTARHTLFSVERNFELDKIVPIIASVKTKLGKGGSEDE